MALQVELLHHIEIPQECEDYPALAEEIMDAYLHYTKFSVKVWINYDTASRRFYIDQRAKDCGNLVLQPKEEESLARFFNTQTGQLQFDRVRFEVGTPFKTLCYLDLRVVPSQLNVGGVITTKAVLWSITEEDIHFIDYIAHVRERIENVALEDSDGLQLSDIRNVATLMCRPPTNSEILDKKRGEKDSPWMGLYSSREWNLGYLDFALLGKTCNIQRCGVCKF